MKIQCNEAATHIAATTLADALIELGYERAHVATAVNGEFVPRSMHSATTLNPGDCLDIVAPMQGG